MSSSSADGNAFDNLRWPHISALLNVLVESKVHHEGLIERRYCELASQYAPTIEFLAAIEMAARRDGVVSVNDSLPDEASAWKEVVLDRLLHKETRYRLELFDYLAEFSLCESVLSRAVDISNPASGSGIRNFLIELGVVQYVQSNRLYVIEPSYSWIAIVAQGERKSVLPSKLSLRLEAQDEIGRAAELAVVEWERLRLGKGFAHLIEHVSERNAAAGYDVLSATVANGTRLRRFIEVKAVSRQNFRFYWTQNEVEVAAALGPLYYLYLVPVNAGGVPDVSEAKQISDPCTAVLSSANWRFEASVLECQLRREDSTDSPKGQ
jgi:hypothetical protein